MKTLTSYAHSFLGKPYSWGGETPHGGFDCSGLVQEILKSVGLDPPGDQTAQALMDYFLAQGVSFSKPIAGCLVFYGDDKRARHVAFSIDSKRVVEAAGGGSKTKDFFDSIRDKAFVRMRPYDYRKDIIGIVNPIYPDWVRENYEP